LELTRKELELSRLELERSANAQTSQAESFKAKKDLDEIIDVIKILMGRVDIKLNSGLMDINDSDSLSKYANKFHPPETITTYPTQYGQIEQELNKQNCHFQNLIKSVNDDFLLFVELLDQYSIIYKKDINAVPISILVKTSYELELGFIIFLNSKTNKSLINPKICTFFD